MLLSSDPLVLKFVGRIKYVIINEVHCIKSLANSSIECFHPYSVFNIEKLKMFGIPSDQQLTARQLVTLYSAMAQVDEHIVSEFEPSKFFNYSAGSNVPIWLSRKGLREYENGLKERFLQWLDVDEQKCVEVISQLGVVASKEFYKRSKPFNMPKTALHNIVSVMDTLKITDRLPAICFNDDREMCKNLAIRVFNE